MIRDQLCKMEQNFRSKLRLLPYVFKKIGGAFAILSFIGLLLVKYIGPAESEALRMILRQTLILSFFVAAVSRDKVEDERVEKLRTYAFAYAFIFGVLFAILQPYINYFVDSLMGATPDHFEQMNAFSLLSFMLMIYLGFFESFKRQR